ncbi:PepSY domain-containing protein [Flavobacterium sp.]|uniref:PepSY domain-containing protein n=1 Tax=Flavobacterium sp. TaxID=239 RepID=UPI00286C4C31|nr:PepSY domain-containing protein [Flavobacterium sp.]
MRYLYLLFCFGFCTSVLATNINTAQIIHVSDSILVSRVGEHLKEYFEISDTGTHYKYLISKNKIAIDQFLTKKKITKNIVEIWILYHFNYTKIEGMKSGIWVKLDGNLQLIEEPNLNSVPDFLIHDSPINFISKNDAKAMAIKVFTQKVYEVTEPKLEYIKKNEKYVYTVANKTNHTNNQKITEMEIVEIDVFTGKLISRYDSYNGLIER